MNSRAHENDPDLTDRVALVTGGGRGIGRAITQALAGVGTTVAVCSRTAADLERAATSLPGADVVGVVADVSDRDSVDAMVREVESRLGSVDVLVNNAGVCRAVGPVWEVDPELWWKDVATSLRGAFLCSRAVLPGMIRRGGGRIVNVSSYAATRPDPYTSGYGAAKAALVHFTGSLAAETAELDVQVFAIAPGTVRTQLTRDLEESEAGRRWLPKFETMAEDDWVRAERAGALVVALASGRADGLSGRFFHVLDDVESAIENQRDVVASDLYVMRLRRRP